MKKKKHKLLLIVGLMMCLICGGCQSYAPEKTEMYEVLDSEKVQGINLNQGYTFGNPNAPIIMVEYTSYQCIDCANLHNNIGDVLKNYIDRGIIFYVFKPILHPKFENDIEICQRFYPENYEDIAFIFDKFELYAHKDKEILLDELGIGDMKNDQFDSMNPVIQSELVDLDITYTPTVIIQNREYVEIVFSSEEFSKLIEELYSKNEKLL